MLVSEKVCINVYVASVWVLEGSRHGRLVGNHVALDLGSKIGHDPAQRRNNVRFRGTASPLDALEFCVGNVLHNPALRDIEEETEITLTSHGS